MNKTMNEIFSHNLRNALYMKGRTQAELAKGVGVTEVSVSKWINGINVPRPKKIEEICQFLRVRKEDLLLDHTQTVMLAPADVLADAMKDRPELYDIFNALLQMNSSDLELISNLIKRIAL